MKRLEGKTAWISGGTSGIGAATARLFSREGAGVAVVGVRDDQGEAIREELRAAGGRAVYLPADVSVESEVAESIKRTVKELGPPDILVNNAGIVHVGDLHECSEADWDRVMAVNVKSIFFSLKHAVPFLVRSRGASIVNVGSISSFVGQLKTPIYTTSKGAVLLLTKSIALDYARYGIRCNCVCPGITDTPMLRAHLNTSADPEATLAERSRRVPIGRAMSPEEVAKSILYFASDESAGVTGASLTVDGGYLAAAEWDARVASEGITAG